MLLTVCRVQSAQGAFASDFAYPRARIMARQQPACYYVPCAMCYVRCDLFSVLCAMLKFGRQPAHFSIYNSHCPVLPRIVMTKPFGAGLEALMLLLHMQPIILHISTFPLQM